MTSINVIVGYQSLLKWKLLMRVLHPFNESVYTPNDMLSSGILISALQFYACNDGNIERLLSRKNPAQQDPNQPWQPGYTLLPFCRSACLD